MSLWKELSNRIRHVTARSDFDEQLINEIDGHIEARAADLRREGLGAAEAISRARREFGPVAISQEDSRAAWRFQWLEDLLADVRYGLRLIGRSPGFSAMIVLSLSLGIGANTAIFSVVDNLMLKNLPVRDPQQLVSFSSLMSGMTGGATYFDTLQYPRFENLRKTLSSFSDVSAVCDIDRSNITVNGLGGGLDESQISVALVSGNYFSLLGVDPLIGVTLTPDDDRVPGGHPVAVISYAYWKQKFGLTKNVVGRTFTLSNVTYTIVGVAPASFTGDWVGKPTEIWIPIQMQSQVMPERPGLLSNPGPPWIRVIARLKPGVSISSAQAEVSTVAARIDGTTVTSAQEPSVKVESYARGYSPQRNYFGNAFWILAALVGFVLLIACANVANLLLARSAARRGEIAVRFALGARRGRVIRQLLTESFLLAALGSIAGVVLASWGTNGLLRFMNSSALSGSIFIMNFDTHLNARLLLFSVGICLLTSILFGLAPALSASRQSGANQMKSIHSTSGSLIGRFGIGRALVVSQVALSLLLLIGAGLFLRTLHNLKSQDLGYDRQNIFLAWTAPGQSGRTGSELAELFPVVQDRIGLIPGVLSVGPSAYGLLAGSGGSPGFVDGHVAAPQEDIWIRWNLVAPRYFESMGMKLLLGRDLKEQDNESAPQVAVINQTMAHFYFGDANPVGKYFRLRRVTSPPIEIVGVVGDARGYDSLREQTPKMIFIPYRQDLKHLSVMCVAVRAVGDPIAMKTKIQGVLRSIDRNLPVLAITTMEEQLDGSLVQERLIAMLSGLFSGLTLLLACLGLYGLISHTVARKTNEIGIRMALGATRGSVLKMILASSVWLVIAGVAVGVATALAITRLVSSQLFGIGAADPPTIAEAVTLMLLVSAVAALLPAYRASKVDPMVALRYE